MKQILKVVYLAPLRATIILHCIVEQVRQHEPNVVDIGRIPKGVVRCVVDQALNEVRRDRLGGFAALSGHLVSQALDHSRDVLEAVTRGLVLLNTACIVLVRSIDDLAADIGRELGAG